MEPMEILGLAQKNIFGDPVGAFQGAQRGALNNQQAQMQNLQMMLGMQDKQRLRDIAPQLGQAISGSGMPMAEQFGMLVEADPTKAEFALRESMDYSIAQAKRQMMDDPINSALISEAMDELKAIETSAMILLDPKKTNQARELALKNYTQDYQDFTQARAQLSQRVQNASLVDGILPKNVMRPSELLNKAEEMGFKRQAQKDRQTSLGIQQEQLGLAKNKFANEIKKDERDSLDKLDERVRKALTAENLMTPEGYDSTIKSLESAKSFDSIFGLAKLLSQIIEPGLSVTEGEAGNYVVGGQGAFAKFVNDKIGTSEVDTGRLLALAKEWIAIKKARSQEIVAQRGDVFGFRKQAEQKKSGDTPKKSVKGLKRF